MVAFGKVGHGSYFATPRKGDYGQADTVQERVGIGDLAENRCNELSGGQLQLVFIAGALINSPQLLILDEPEAHLDFRNQLRLLKLVQSVVLEQNISCVINIHYPNNAVGTADKCFLLGMEAYKFGTASEVMSEEDIEVKVTPHQLRHTNASLMIANGPP